MRNSLFAISILSALVGCGNKDPFAGGGDASSGGDGHVVSGDGHGGGDGGTHHCVAAPTRIITLGDSIVDCTVIGGPQSADCISKKFSDYVIAHYGPSATYEPHAVGGAVLADIAGQLAGVPAGTGPALFIIYIGGNDLAPFIFQSDSAAMAAYTGTIEPTLVSTYNSVFATLADTAKFPMGATLLMNTQYDPFDDCTAPPYNLSATKISLLNMFNDKVNAISAQHADASIVVDQHTPFLGHGHAYNVSTCPYYQAGDASWMEDVIHANAAGNVDLANVADGGADGLYRDCIQ